MQVQNTFLQSLEVGEYLKLLLITDPVTVIR